MSELLAVAKKCLVKFMINMGGLLPVLLVLDFGMGIQLHRDYGWGIVVAFLVALVFYATVYARYLHDS